LCSSNSCSSFAFEEFDLGKRSLKRYCLNNPMFKKLV
jgi:hypothetical protein